MRLLFALIILILITGCSSIKPLDVSVRPVPKPDLVLPKEDVLSLRKVEWTLVTPENADKVFAEVKKQGRPVVLFATTDEGYENLGLNLSDIRAYIQQQQAIKKAYQNYYLETETAIKAANKDIDDFNEQLKKANEEIEASWFDKMKEKFSKEIDKLNEAE